ncbi:MAG: hypothetical protein E5Y14_33060 [Mesorhizobium sp.]|nr:MAG: hypothetical protein E5Y14_33060 [Mesorhizobium sp.]
MRPFRRPKCRQRGGSEEIFRNVVQFLCRVRNHFSFESAPSPLPGACAAPHLPVGILSPYSDGERSALIAGFANHQRCKNGVEAAPAPLPVPIRGEDAGVRTG